MAGSTCGIILSVGREGGGGGGGGGGGRRGERERSEQTDFFIGSSYPLSACVAT